MKYLLLLLLAACSGAVSEPTPPTPLTVTPSPATVYYGVPATFIITGGSPPYIAVASNQVALPIAGSTGSNLTFIPGPVGSDTQVTLTVRDQTTGFVEVPVTVKPNVVSSAVTITPTVNACQPGICSGADALVSVTLASAVGAPRAVRFERISGDFQVVTDATVATDSTGKAQATIRINPTAVTQTATIQVTDVISGSFQRVSFQIIQKTTASFTTIPSTVTFTGRDSTACGFGTADVYIFGGAPPYTIGTLSGFSISPQFVYTNGGSFQIAASGMCTSGPLPISDSSGGVGSILVSSVLGSGNPPPVTVSPTAITLNDCGIQYVSVAGGNGTYTLTVSSPAIVAGISGNSIAIQRAAGGAAGTYTISVSSGNSTATIIVSAPASVNC